MALGEPHLRAGATTRRPRDKVEQAVTAWVAARRHDVVYRFGDYIYDLDAPLEGMEVHLDLEEAAA